MTAIKLDGEMLSAEIKEGLRERIAVLAEKGVTPGLGTLLVGDDGPSANYVAMKHRDSEELGMGSREVHLPAMRHKTRSTRWWTTSMPIRRGRLHHAVPVPRRP